MASKRKWDQAGPEPGEVDGPSAKATKVDEGKTASEAAAAAAAIAAKIAAQFASGGGVPGATKDPHDAEFTHDIDINDVRNRYLLTKGSTQQQVRTLRLTRLLQDVDMVALRYTMRLVLPSAPRVHGILTEQKRLSETLLSTSIFPPQPKKPFKRPSTRSTS